MTTQSWSTMWTQTTASPWRDICSRGPATPSRPGTGTRDAPSVCKRQRLAAVDYIFGRTVDVKPVKSTTNACDLFVFVIYFLGVGFPSRTISLCTRRNLR